MLLKPWKIFVAKSLPIRKRYWEYDINENDKLKLRTKTILLLLMSCKLIKLPSPLYDGAPLK
jgi:hypothetical protein